MTGDLLREASDPTTPGERLAAMLWAFERQGHGDGNVLDAIFTNPNLPLDLLADYMRRGDTSVWDNPLIPYLLLSEPSPAYREGARRTLLDFRPKGKIFLLREPIGSATSEDLLWFPPKGDPTLEQLLELWHRARHEDDREVRALARHLAGLFGLPWPSEAP